LSLEGRVVLLNFILSSIPIYWISFYKLPSQIRIRIDKLRRRFLWFGGSSVKKKIALVSWNVVCKSKQQGCLGIIDIEAMNKSLLIKWLVIIKDPYVQGWWETVLLYKYPRLFAHNNVFLFFKIFFLLNKDILDVSISWKVNNGTVVSFWIDRWFDETTFAFKYPYLFSISLNPKITVSVALTQSGQNLLFSRQLVGVYYL
jgi:hypothetical protein